jgi:hypothetical protein
MNLPPDLEAAILRGDGQVNPPMVRDYSMKTPNAAQRRAKEARKLVEATFTPPATWTLPIATVSEANTRCHWAQRYRRFKAQQNCVKALLVEPVVAELATNLARGRVLRIMLTRLADRAMDTDNLAGAFKAIRDQLAVMLKIDDGSSLVEWHYWQEKCEESGITIKMELLEADGVRIEMAAGRW